MTEIDRERQKRLRALLIEEKRRLWTAVCDDIFRSVGEGLHAQYDIPQDIGEQGIIDLLEDTGMGVADIRRQELTRMETALRKLDEGSYGLCEDCGVAIDEGRLHVTPYASRCFGCQKRREGPKPGGLTL